MNTDRSNGEVAGAKFFNWAIIVGAAVLIATSFASFAPQQHVQAAKAPNETVVVTAGAHHAS